MLDLRSGLSSKLHSLGNLKVPSSQTNAHSRRRRMPTHASLRCVLCEFREFLCEIKLRGPGFLRLLRPLRETKHAPREKPCHQCYPLTKKISTDGTDETDIASSNTLATIRDIIIYGNLRVIAFSPYGRRTSFHGNSCFYLT